MPPTRRQTLVAALAGWPLGRIATVVPAASWPLRSARATNEETAALLRTGGVVLAFRHALAPGTFDPSGFDLARCDTQRNLSDAGRAQARRIGAWFQARHLVPEQVRSSPWCRCMDTATLAFGAAVPWAALGSPSGKDEAARAAQLRVLRRALASAERKRGRFEVWVTHMFVLADLAGQDTASGDGLVLASGPGDTVRVLARLDTGT